MIKYFVVWALIFCAFSCTTRSAAEGYRYDTYETAGGWGYEIYYNNRMLIKQPVVPVVAGNHPFKEKGKAALAAEMVVRKLKAGQPPALTRNDIDSLQLGENP